VEQGLTRLGFNNSNQGIVEQGLTRLGFNNSNQGIVEQGLTRLGFNNSNQGIVEQGFKRFKNRIKQFFCKILMYCVSLCVYSRVHENKKVHKLLLKVRYIVYLRSYSYIDQEQQYGYTILCGQHLKYDLKQNVTQI